MILIHLLPYCMLSRLNSNILENSASIRTVLESLPIIWLIDVVVSYGKY